MTEQVITHFTGVRRCRVSVAPSEPCEIPEAVVNGNLEVVEGLDEARVLPLGGAGNGTAAHEPRR
jgi:hypothetical protein